MTTFPTLQVAVDACVDGVRVIRAAGVLDPPSAERLMRVVDAQLALRAAGRVVFGHLVVDLANVTRFDAGGLEALHLDRHAGLHLTGCGGRVFLLPAGVGRLMRDFSTFPTAEVAIEHLAAPAPVPAPRTSSDPLAADSGELRVEPV